jgi:serine/threonine protein kinase
MLEPGTRLGNGRYEVREKLGQGGYSDVYRVINVEAGVESAMKVNVPHDIAASRSFNSRVYDGSKLEPKERAERELKVLQKIHHPNIINLRDSVELPDGNIGLIIDAVQDPRSLEKLILKEGTKFSIDDRISVCLQLCSAVSYLQGQGYVHKDIRLSNVLVEHGNVVKLIDFGLAIKRENFEDRWGSFWYGPPEKDTQSANYDLWSLALVVYEVLTGKYLLGERLQDSRETREAAKSFLDKLTRSQKELDKLLEERLLLVKKWTLDYREDPWSLKIPELEERENDEPVKSPTWRVFAAYLYGVIIENTRINPSERYLPRVGLFVCEAWSGIEGFDDTVEDGLKVPLSEKSMKKWREICGQMLHESWQDLRKFEKRCAEYNYDGVIDDWDMTLLTRAVYKREWNL